MNHRSRFLTMTGALAAGGGALAYAAFRRDMKTACERIDVDRQFLDSAHGPIEFAESGDGPALLMIHGAGGGFDQGLDTARVFVGDRFRVIAPSRFGYLGTPMPEDASAEAQADAHLRLLDALQLDRVPVVALSAGAPSAMRLCLDHPERCSVLVLIVPGTYAPEHTVSSTPSPLFGKVLNAIASSDLAFWIAMKVARSVLIKTILGTPVEVYRNAPDDLRREVDATLVNILPISRRYKGIENDGAVVSNLKRYPLEEMRVPTLVISAADDPYGTYENGLCTAEHIPEARFIGFPKGGHLLIGHDEEVREQIKSFFDQHLEPRKKTAMAS